jgi:hypothetical protein
MGLLMCNTFQNCVKGNIPVPQFHNQFQTDLVVGQKLILFCQACRNLIVAFLKQPLTAENCLAALLKDKP